MGDNKKVFIIKFIGWIAVQAIIWNIPPAGALTDVGMHTIAAFAGLIYGLICMKEYAIVCFGAVIIMAFSGAYGSMNDSFIAGLGSNTFVMIFSISLLSGLIITTGLAKTLALKLINAKITAGRPWMLTFIIFMTGFILSLFIHPLVIIIILSDLIIEMFRGLNLKGNRWTMFTLMTMAIVCISAQHVMPFQVANNLYFGILTEFSGNSALTLSPVVGVHLLAQLVFTILLIGFGMLLCVLFCKKDVEALKSYKPSDEKFPITRDMKMAIWILAIYAFLQLIPIVLPQGAIKTFLEMPSVTGYSALAAVIAMCLFRKDGKHFITYDDINNNLNWYILLMLMALSSVTAPMSGEISGVVPWLTDIITPICTSVSPYWAYVILIVFGLVFTNLTDNIAVMFIVVPVMYVVSQAVGLNPLGLMSWLIVAVEFAILLPASCPHIALIFGKADTGYVKRGKMILWALPWLAFTLVICLTLGWWMQGLYATVM